MRRDEIAGANVSQYHGIMSGHHISEHSRLKILRPVLKKMYNHAVSVVFGDWFVSLFSRPAVPSRPVPSRPCRLLTPTRKTNSPVEPVIRTHIENLLERFRCPRPINTPPVLVSTKTVTSPPETPDVQPFIVLCPADIVTLCQAVYPQSMPAQIDPRDIQKKLGGSSSRASSSKMFAKSPGGFETVGGSVSAMAAVRP